MQSAEKKQYKWLHEPVEVNKEERAKILKKRQESPTQVSFCFAIPMTAVSVAYTALNSRMVSCLLLQTCSINFIL